MTTTQLNELLQQIDYCIDLQQLQNIQNEINKQPPPCNNNNYLCYNVVRNCRRRRRIDCIFSTNPQCIMH